MTQKCSTTCSNQDVSYRCQMSIIIHINSPRSHCDSHRSYFSHLGVEITNKIMFSFRTCIYFDIILMGLHSSNITKQNQFQTISDKHTLF